MTADRGPGILADELGMNRNNINNFLGGVTPKGERWVTLRDWAHGVSATGHSVAAVVKIGQAELAKWAAGYAARILEAQAKELRLASDDPTDRANALIRAVDAADKRAKPAKRSAAK